MVSMCRGEGGTDRPLKGHFKHPSVVLSNPIGARQIDATYAYTQPRRLGWVNDGGGGLVGRHEQSDVVMHP